MIEERLAKMEVMMQRLARRSHRFYTGIVPPSLVVLACEEPAEDGHMFSFICPIDGEVKSVGLDIGELVSEKGLQCKVFHKGLIDSTYYIKLVDDTQVVDMSFHLKRGDVLSVYVSNPVSVKGITLTLAIQPLIKDTKQFKVAYEDSDA